MVTVQTNAESFTAQGCVYRRVTGDVSEMVVSFPT